MNPLRITLACLAAAGLAACAGEDRTDLVALTNPAPCPQASVLSDASRLVQLNGPARYENVGFTGEILGIRSLCEYDDEGGPIDSDLTVDFALGRGPSADGDRHTYGYFVAVTRRDRAVIYKREFAMPVDFDGDQIVYIQDTIDRILIPRLNDEISGENFEIVVGFLLTDDELAHNRSGVRFRPDAGTFDQPV